MVKALFDTNILIDYLRGIPAAREELDRHETRAISVITWMEVLTGAPPPHAQATRDFLAGCNSQAPHREQERRSWRYGGASVIRIKRG